MVTIKKFTENILTMKESRFLFMVFIVSLILISLISAYIFHHTFITTDENAFIFQAKTFAKGKLYVPSHFLRSFFNSTGLVNDGRYFSKYFPSHALIIVPGIWLKFPYLIPHLLSALGLILTYLIARECYNVKIATYSTLLTLVSPLYLFISSTLYSQITSFFFISLFILCFIKMIRRDGVHYPLFSGIGLGIAFNARPLDALVVSLPFIIYGLYNLREEKSYLPRFLIFLGCFSIFIMMFLSYNWALTGSPFYTTYDYYSDIHNTPYDHYGLSEFHSFQKGVAKTLYNLKRLNSWLFGWPFSLIFILLFPLIRGKKVWDYIFLSVFIVLIVEYLFHWYPGVPETGPLYYYSAVGALSILTTRSISNLHELSKGTRRSITKSIVLLFIIASFLYSFFIFYPKKFDYIHRATLSRQNPYFLIKEKGIKNAIFFLRNSPYDFISQNYVINSPELNDDILFVNDMGKKNKLLMDYYPKRNYYAYTFIYKTGKGNITPLYRKDF